MLKPSYAELMEVLNKDTEEASEITSRYTIVIAAAKRARQIIAGDEPMVQEKQGKPLSTAVEEISEGKIKVVPEGEGTVINIKKDNDEEIAALKKEFEHKNIVKNDSVSEFIEYSEDGSGQNNEGSNFIDFDIDDDEIDDEEITIDDSDIEFSEEELEQDNENPNFIDYDIDDESESDDE